jgi:cysteine desulfurase family protein (TIGR01976 family)
MTDPDVAYDIDAVRKQFPALDEGWALFDGPGGTQVPTAVTEAIGASLRSAVSNRGGPFGPSLRAEETVLAARQAIADLLGGDAGGVILGPSTTSVTYVLSNALAKTWRPGDEVVVTRLDHDANVRPWVQAAERAGATLRWWDIDTATCELAHDAPFSDRTRLVAVTAASNAVGTRSDVPGIAAAAHDVGALVHVDGVHLTPHAPVDVKELGVDFYACSSYKFCGPHLGATIADPALLATLHPDKLLPASDRVPQRFEHGTPPFELHAGLVATVDWLAGVVDGDGDRRRRVLRSMTALEAYEHLLFTMLLDGLSAVPGLRTYGAASSRTPTVAFRIDGLTPRQVTQALATDGVCAWDGHYYAIELVRALGLLDAGGMVRVGIAPYTNTDDVVRLLEAVQRLTAR